MSVPPLHPGLHPGHEEVNHHREEVFWNIAVRFELVFHVADFADEFKALRC
jgi:hypothetical protein